MGDEKDKDTANAGNDAGGAERTFTQAELDSIVKDRLAREREKYADYEGLKTKARKYDELAESERKAAEKVDKLQKQLDAYTKADSLRQTREKISQETKVPANLLTGEDEESCRSQAKAILEFASSNNPLYPDTAKNGAHRDAAKTDESMRELVHQIFKKGD